MSYPPTPRTQRNLKAWRAELFEKLRDHSPYVKRKRHKKAIAKVTARIDAISDCLLALPSFAASVPAVPRIAIDVSGANELCLFASFAPEPTLKPHVLEHVGSLLDQGIEVVLIANTTHAADDFELDAGLAARLSGCLIRVNVGFDFAAWAHAYSLLSIPEECKRLYLINDSIVGPLQPDAHRAMMARIRDSSADMIGLTENHNPQPHMQTYFLVINQRLLRSTTFDRMMRGIVNLAAKEQVIDLYETQITRFLRSNGFRCEALFPRVFRYERRGDDTYFSWASLIEIGFPFIKSKALDVSRGTPEANRLIPERFLARVRLTD